MNCGCEQIFDVDEDFRGGILTISLKAEDRDSV